MSATGIQSEVTGGVRCRDANGVRADCGCASPPPPPPPPPPPAVSCSTCVDPPPCRMTLTFADVALAGTACFGVCIHQATFSGSFCLPKASGSPCVWNTFGDFISADDCGPGGATPQEATTQIEFFESSPGVFEVDVFLEQTSPAPSLLIFKATGITWDTCWTIDKTVSNELVGAFCTDDTGGQGGTVHIVQGGDCAVDCANGPCDPDCGGPCDSSWNSATVHLAATDSTACATFIGDVDLVGTGSNLTGTDSADTIWTLTCANDGDGNAQWTLFANDADADNICQWTKPGVSPIGTYTLDTVFNGCTPDFSPVIS